MRIEDLKKVFFAENGDFENHIKDLDEIDKQVANHIKDDIWPVFEINNVDYRFNFAEGGKFFQVDGEQCGDILNSLSYSDLNFKGFFELREDGYKIVEIKNLKIFEIKKTTLEDEKKLKDCKSGHFLNTDFSLKEELLKDLRQCFSNLLEDYFKGINEDSDSIDAKKYEEYFARAKKFIFVQDFIFNELKKIACNKENLSELSKFLEAEVAFENAYDIVMQYKQLNKEKIVTFLIDNLKSKKQSFEPDEDIFNIFLDCNYIKSIFNIIITNPEAELINLENISQQDVVDKKVDIIDSVNSLDYACIQIFCGLKDGSIFMNPKIITVAKAQAQAQDQAQAQEGYYMRNPFETAVGISSQASTLSTGPAPATALGQKAPAQKSPAKTESENQKSAQDNAEKFVKIMRDSIDAAYKKFNTRYGKEPVILDDEMSCMIKFTLFAIRHRGIGSKYIDPKKSDKVGELNKYAQHLYKDNKVAADSFIAMAVFFSAEFQKRCKETDLFTSGGRKIERLADVYKNDFLNNVAALHSYPGPQDQQDAAAIFSIYEPEVIAAQSDINELADKGRPKYFLTKEQIANIRSEAVNKSKGGVRFGDAQGESYEVAAASAAVTNRAQDRVSSIGAEVSAAPSPSRSLRLNTDEERHF